MRAACAGLVLAAGASSRMGCPKALLECADGEVLLQRQVRLLENVGCLPVHALVGSAASEIMAVCSNLTYTVNERWRQGRVSSVQAGVRGLGSFSGCLLLPVDTVGVREETLLRMCEAADDEVLSVRPFCNGQRGNLCWFSGRLIEQMMNLDSGSEQRARLDDLLRPIEVRIDVDDEGVLSNMNRPEDWQTWLKRERMC